MYCVTLTTGDPERVLAVLRRNRVKFKVETLREEGRRPVARTPEDAQRIYDLVAAGELTYKAIAARCQTSYHTVLRIIRRPEKYGVKGAPIKRS